MYTATKTRYKMRFDKVSVMAVRCLTSGGSKAAGAQPLYQSAVTVDWEGIHRCGAEKVTVADVTDVKDPRTRPVQLGLVPPPIVGL